MRVLANENRSVDISAPLHAGFGPWREILDPFWNFARKQPLGAVSAAVLGLLIFGAIFADVVSPHDPYARSSLILRAPSLNHPFGTDQLGRDSLSRVIHGARLTLLIGLAVTLISGVIGMILGVASAYFKGWVDRIAVMSLDAIMAFPHLVLAIALVAALGRSVENVILAVLLGFIARNARLIRANALTVSSMPYIDAARALGAGNLRILIRHIMPNVVGIVIVISSLNIGMAMLVEAGLSFLGLGPPPPTPSWGRILSEDGQQFFRSAPWLGIFPGVALMVGVFAFNLLGDALRDHLDPRMRGQS